MYASILSEADKWGGDCIKFAGDAVLFCWPIHAEEGTEEFDTQYRNAAISALKCSLLIHESVKDHPEVNWICCRSCMWCTCTILLRVLF
jgi:hypothetical protein